ncbi:TasA family protein [uncultured Friedmanniella sp.]|uniref:TasA family protein n=1 Tax=uncultured Friedmanniella sp. TaxID=335381 RepID=UPI0035C95A84
MPPSPRSVRASRWLLWPVAAAATLALVSQASYAAFSSKVSNGDNSFSVGTVNLSDDDSGTALFILTNLKPGSSGSRCIAVTSSGTLPSSVKLYATDVTTTKGLGSYVSLTITQGTGASFGSCSGFSALATGSAVYSGTVTAFTGAATGYGSGVGSWSPSGTATETRSYQFGYTVSAATPDSAQGGVATFGLTWEAQNT